MIRVFFEDGLVALAVSFSLLVVQPKAVGAEIQVAGNLAFLGNAQGNLVLFDVSDPVNPAPVSIFIQPGSVEGVFVTGQHAFVAGGNSGLTIIDVSNPANPARVGGLGTEGSSQDVVVDRGVAYVADGEDGIAIVDIIEPAYPSVLNALPVGGSALALDLSANLLYVACGEAGLQVYDVADPLRPYGVGRIMTVTTAKRVRVSAGFAYVICDGGRLEIIDVLDPSSPARVGSYQTIGNLADLDVLGLFVFLANTNGTLEVLEATNSAAPTVLSTYPVTGGATGVRVIGNSAYVRNNAGVLVVVPLTDFAPAAPRLIGPVDGVTALAGGRAVLSVLVAGTPPLTFQWSKNGSPLVDEGRVVGATSPSISISNLVFADAGQYSVIVSNAYGEIASSNVLNVVTPGTPVERGGIDSSGVTLGVDAVGSVVYVAAGDGGLEVIDARNWRWPAARETYDTAGSAQAVQAVGEFAFVADGPAGLLIIDDSSFTPLGNFDTPGTAYGLHAVGGIVFVADGESGLEIIDATKPTEPLRLGRYETPGDALGTAYEVQVVGGLAYVAYGAAGLQILGITNPASVSRVGKYDTPGVVRSVRVVGNTVFLADGDGGLLMLDIGDPANPNLIGSYATIGSVVALEVVDGLALLAEGTAGLELVSVSNPTNIARLGINSGVGDVTDVRIVGTTVYASTRDRGLRILELKGLTPTEPVIASPPQGVTLLPGQSISLHVIATGSGPLNFQWFKDGRVLFNGSRVQGVGTDTLTLSNLQYHDTGTYSVEVRNGWNLMTWAAAELFVVPVGTPVFASAHFDTNDALNVDIVGQLLFLATRTGGLRVIDCRDPLNPVVAGGHATMGLAQAVRVVGHLAYVAAWDAGIEIFDVATPTNPIRVGRCDTPGFARGIAVSGSRAYVADYHEGLRVIDVSNPADPVLLGSAATTGFALDVRVAGLTAFVAASGGGLEVFDVGDPFGVVRLGGLDTSGEAESLELAGNYAYVADYNGGLQIIDISNPASPQKVGEFLTRGDAFRVQLVNNLVYVAEGIRGVEVVDVTNPVQPSFALSGRTGESVHGLQVAGKHAFLADRKVGLVVAELLGLAPSAPQVVQFPDGLTGVPGLELVISVAARGTPPLDYQWYKDDVPLSSDGRIDGATGPFLRIRNVTITDEGSYRVVVSSPYGSASSGSATVTIAGAPPIAPAIQSQPISQVASAGTSVEFRVVNTGSAPLNYRWYRNGQPLRDGAQVSGAASAILRITDVRRQHAGLYELKIWNTAGVAVSEPAVLTFVGPLQSQLNAAPVGTTVVVPSGVHEETLFIEKDLTLAGAGADATILDARGLGSVLTITNDAKVTLRGMTLRNGRAPTNEMGGAIKNHGELVLDGCVIAGSAAELGGGIANLRSARIVSSVISNNLSTGPGGGLFNGPGARWEMSDSTIAQNMARNGGGIFNRGDIFATNCTVFDNRATGVFGFAEDGNGAGISIVSGAVWLVNCTVSGNQAFAHALSPGGGAGGGIFADGGTLELRSCTLCLNTASKLGGGVRSGSNSVVRGRNTIIASNSSQAAASDFIGNLQSEGYNLLQSTSGAEIAGDTTGNLVDVDHPLLGLLQDNGGPTWTHALRYGSPAIDAGACDGPTTDQRGVARPYDIPWVNNTAGGCDIGAFEYVNQAPSLALPPDQFMDEDGPTFIVQVMVQDIDTPDVANVTILSENQNLLPSGNLVVIGSPPLLSLSLTPAPDAYGTTRIRVSATDAVGATASGFFDVVVRPVNDPPILSDIADQVADPFSPSHQVAFAVADVDNPLETLFIRAMSSNTNLVSPVGLALAGSGNARTLTIVHTPARAGLTRIAVSASDGAAEATEEFLLTVPLVPVSLSLSQPTQNGFNLSWPGAGTLQSAPSPAGPWEDIGSTSPFTVAIQSGTARFYRVISR